MEDFSLQDVFSIIFRRKKYFLITTSCIFLLALYFVVNWSNYRSTATVQIEASDIDASITTTNPNEVAETLADQRINQIQQMVTSLDSLAQIIKKFNLYPESIENTPIARLTDKMRKKIKVELISSIISNPAAAQKQTAEQLSAIAFELSFDYNNPQLTQQVTDELVTRFLDEDLKMRRTKAQETSKFLEAQIDTLEKSMAEQEKAIAEFRAKNGESGPAALMFNQQTAATIGMNIRSIESQMTSNEGTQGAIRAELATIDPYSRVIEDGQLLTTPAIQLKALETQYTGLTSRYGPDHPDVVKARRQIQALKAQLGPAEEHARLQAEITDLRTNLAAAESTKGEDHPDVLAMQKQLKTLEDKVANAATPTTTAEDTIKHDADNPAYLQLSAQLASAETQHKSLVAQRDELVKEQTKYNQMLAQNPSVEQEMAKLTRDYDNSQLRYRQLKEKKMAADMNEQMEVGRKGQHLVITNPPEIPEETHPKRMLLVLGGLMLSLMCGISSVVIVEVASQNVHSANHLANIIGTAPLAIIPRIRSVEDKNNAMIVKQYIKSYTPIVVQYIKKSAGLICQRLKSFKKT